MNKDCVIEDIIRCFEADKIFTFIVEMKGTHESAFNFCRWCLNNNPTMIRRNFSKKELHKILNEINPELFSFYKDYYDLTL